MELIPYALPILSSMILGVITTVLTNLVTVPLCYSLIWRNGKELKERVWIYNAWFFGNIILFFILTVLFYNYFFYNV